MVEKKVYHINKRAKDNKWTIKLEGSEKVIKTFTTKIEAEEYVNGLAERQDGSYQVHASKGRNKGKIIKK
mgnify:CR=1 FL=1